MASTATPSSSGSAKRDQDRPWKEALERFFPEFLALLFPAIHAEIDWSVPDRALDSELQQITGDADSGRRDADKLLDVRTTDGRETWVLVHVDSVAREIRPRHRRRLPRAHHGRSRRRRGCWVAPPMPLTRGPNLLTLM